MNQKKNRSFLLLIFFSAMLLITSCSSSKKSDEPIDPKLYLSSTDYSKISLRKIYDYVVLSNDISSPKLNRLELELNKNDKLSNLSMEIINIDNEQSYTALYDSKTGIFKIKLESDIQLSDSELFDAKLLESSESLLRKLDQDRSYHIYFLNLISSGSLDISSIINSDFFLLEDDEFKKIKNPDEISAYETLHFFAVYDDSKTQNVPSYFIVKPKT